MPQEIMHIMFEGAIPYVIGHLLKYIILTEKAFALAQMNRRLREFNYGYTQMADKLQKISEDMLRADWDDDKGLSAFGQHAAKKLNWLFVRILPFIIGDWIAFAFSLFGNFHSQDWTVFSLLYSQQFSI